MNERNERKIPEGLESKDDVEAEAASWKELENCDAKGTAMSFVTSLPIGSCTSPA
jgi:hypothetical protein